MNDNVKQRLASLVAEHEAGQKMLPELDAKRQTLTQTSSASRERSRYSQS